MTNLPAPARTIDCNNIESANEFVHLSTIANLRVDLRYATPHNFMNRDMYSPLDCAWVHADAARSLRAAIATLKSQRPEVTLVVLDALRPHRVQQAMWDALDGTPLTAYLANPARGSIHSYGMAVDVTLLDADGNELDMGTPFDDMTELSHPALEAQHLQTGTLSALQLANRKLLRDAMIGAGFHSISTEWWHFDCGDRNGVRERFARVI
jgi:zinc D-Ala-D-Ala dipeptidase